MGKILLILQLSLFQKYAVSFTTSSHIKFCFKNFTRLIMSDSEKPLQCELLRDFSKFQFSAFKLLDLPLEENRQNYIRRNVKEVIFSQVNPTPIVSPKLVSFSEDVLKKILNLDPVVTESKEFVDFVSGNTILKGSNPIAHRYGGHQFGYWAMQLGDGRAILIGEIINSDGERWELQLKGSGKTPYSRDGDGRAVLRSSIREFLCSEAMYYLGISTSRAASLVVGENKVVRDLLYDGHPELENTAVVLRIAPSWFRIGSLEILTKTGEIDLLKQLLEFIFEEHFKEISRNEDRVLELFALVARMCSDLVVAWQSVGFTHGVLNTDNISLLGFTIDYGPFGFMEDFDLYFVPNHSDSEARYCYGRQPQVMIFNLMKLINALAPLMSTDDLEKANNIVQMEMKYMNTSLDQRFSEKLGFTDGQNELVTLLIELLVDSKADFTMTFRELSETCFEELKQPSPHLWALSKLSKSSKYSDFLDLYKVTLHNQGVSDEKRMERMKAVNPRYILRNWLAQEAISLAEKGDYSEVKRLLRVLKNPFSRQEEAEGRRYASKPPSWSKSMKLSCSS